MGFFTAFPPKIYPVGDRLLPDGPGFSLQTAGTLAWAAQAAYETSDRDKLQTILTGWNWTLVDVFDQPAPGGWPLAGAKGFVATSGDATIVAVAGTEPENFEDWFQNFDAIPAENGAHSGFQAGAEAVQAELDRLRAAGRGIYLTGHSLGGAIAALTASMLETAQAGRVACVHTIGMPRPGNAKYATAYNAALGNKTFRLVHGADLVTKVGPARMGYRHVGSVLSCPHLGTFDVAQLVPPPEIVDPGEIWAIAAAAAAAIGIGPRNDAPRYPAIEPGAQDAAALLPNQIRDHLPDCYLRALNALPDVPPARP